MTEKFLEDGIILQSEEEIVRYGLDSMKSTLLGLVLSALIGLCFGNILAGIALYMVSFPLRKYAGGYHADTRIGCFITSACSLTVLFAAFYPRFWPREIYVAVMALFNLVILGMAPMESQNKRLSKIEKSVYRRRTILVLLAEDLSLAAGFLLHSRIIISVLAMSIAFAGISLLMGFVKLWYIKQRKPTGRP